MTATPSGHDRFDGAHSLFRCSLRSTFLEDMTGSALLPRSIATLEAFPYLLVNSSLTPHHHSSPSEHSLYGERKWLPRLVPSVSLPKRSPFSRPPLRLFFFPVPFLGFELHLEFTHDDFSPSRSGCPLFWALQLGDEKPAAQLLDKHLRTSRKLVYHRTSNCQHRLPELCNRRVFGDVQTQSTKVRQAGFTTLLCQVRSLSV